MRSDSLIVFATAMLAAISPAVAGAVVNVFACEPEWAALASELGGDRLEIYTATTVRQDPHHIQARPSLIAKARKADLLVCTGAELETGWLPLLLRKAGNARIQPGQSGHFLAAEHVELQDVPEKLDRSMGDIHASGNPHVHTDPRNILRIAGPLHRRLKQIDPDHAETYARRFETFAGGWQRAIDSWYAQLAPVKGAAVVVHHDFWSYLIDWLGLDRIATLEPVPGVSPSSGHLARVRQSLDQQAAAMIIDTGYMNDRPANWLSDQTGVALVTLPATVDFQNGESLYDWFDNLAALLLEPVK
jgi:zinc/manganese transport system substrate-binding protein